MESRHLAALWAGVAVIVAAVAAGIVVDNAILTVSVAAGAIAAVARPAAGILAVLVPTAAVGSLSAFTGLSPLTTTQLADALLLGLWIGVGVLYLAGRSEHRPWLWGGLLAPLLYLSLTGLQALFTEPRSLGIESFHTTAWYMLALLLIAVAPWSTATHLRIARAVAVIALAVGAYACVRLATGSAASEILAARGAQPGLPRSVEPQFFGSFLSGNQLAAWAASAIPFCFALLLAWRGWWRLIAFVAIVTLAVGLLASEVRTGLVAAIGGVALVFALFAFSPALRVRALARAVVLLALPVILAGAYALTLGGSSLQAERYGQLLSPGEDFAYSVRLERWGEALDEIAARPWGHGLGTSGYVAETRNPLRVAGPRTLDSSYLKVGLEQGVALMFLYALALIGLLLGLARRVTLLRDPPRAYLAAGACGTLGALMVLFYAGAYSEGMPVLASWLLVGLGAAQVTMRTRTMEPGEARPPTREGV